MSSNDAEEQDYLFHNAETYNHEESLAWRGRCILGWIGGSTSRNGMTFRQAVQDLEDLYRDDSPQVVENRWTRLFGQIKEGSDLERLLQKERMAMAIEQQGDKRVEIRSLEEHRLIYAKFEKDKKKEEAEKMKAAHAKENEGDLSVVCGEPSNKFCARCQSTLYCSVEHQKSDWKRHKEESCAEPEVSEFFNALHIVRGRWKCQKFVDGQGLVDLTDEEYEKIAFPSSTITINAYPPLFGPYHQRARTFKPPNGKKYFSVIDLAKSLAEFELGGLPDTIPDEKMFGNHISVLDLATCLAESELGGLPDTIPVEKMFGNHIFFQGFENHGKKGVFPLYGS